MKTVAELMAGMTTAELLRMQRTAIRTKSIAHDLAKIFMLEIEHRKVDDASDVLAIASFTFVEVLASTLVHTCAADGQSTMEEWLTGLWPNLHDNALTTLAKYREYQKHNDLKPGAVIR